METKAFGQCWRITSNLCKCYQSYENKATHRNVTINNGDSTEGEEDTTWCETLMRMTSVDCMHGRPTTEGATLAVGRSGGSVVRLTYKSGEDTTMRLFFAFSGYPPYTKF